MKTAFNFAKRVLISVSVPLVLFVLLDLIYPRITLSSLVLWLQLAISPAVLAWGVCFSLKVGMWDFSVGGVIYLAGIIGANLALRMGIEVPGLIMFCPLVGALLGLFTGLAFHYFRIPSIIVSVGMLLIYECITQFIFGGSGVQLSNAVYKLYNFPYNIIIGLIAFVVIYILFNYTKFGYHVRAIGNGIIAAKMAGIKIDRIRVLCFVAGGFFSGLYAVMMLSSSGVMIPVKDMSSMSLVFEGIICVFIALALEKQCNLIIGVYIGALTVQVIKGGILASGFPSMYQQVVIAVVMLLFMSVSSKGREIMRKIRYKRELRLAMNK